MSVRARSMSELERRVAAALHMADPNIMTEPLGDTRSTSAFSICPWDPDFEEFVDGARKSLLFTVSKKPSFKMDSEL